MARLGSVFGAASLAVLCLVATSPAAASGASRAAADASVIGVRAPDRVVVRAGGGRRLVRLRGVKLSEGSGCRTRAARAAVRRFVGSRVRWPQDRKGFVRLRSGRDLGERLVRLGAARAAGGRHPRAAAYRSAQRSARRAARGLWSQCVTPESAAPVPGSSPPSAPAGAGQTPTSTLAPQNGLPAGAYDTGSPLLTDIWVDPRWGDDERDGLTPQTALRTLNAAWERVPGETAPTGTGRRLMLMPGRFDEADVPRYWESRHGTRDFPIVLQAADGPGSVTLPLLNLFDLSYLYLLDLGVQSPGGDVVHCDHCDHLLIRGTRIRGGAESQEALKVNQSQHVFVENADVSGAYDNAIDFVAVQYGHVLASRIHDAADWCAYAKGGSASIRIAYNEIFDCGTGGFIAGQGTGLQFMLTPWIHYEAYDVKVHDNLVHDTEGGGLGVNGGYDVLLAHNTLYRVGSRSHAIEVGFGARSCDGSPGDEGRERCADYLAAGGWGTTVVDDGTNFARIPNRHVFVYDNLIYNPAAAGSPDQHFAIPGPFAAAGEPAVRADDDLQIRGNMIWNGAADLPLGIEDAEQGCRPSNPTCNEAQLRGENVINVREPQLVDPAGGDFRPLPGGTVEESSAIPVPDFSFEDLPTRPQAPAGLTSNAMPVTRSGEPRIGAGRPGAY